MKIVKWKSISQWKPSTLTLEQVENFICEKYAALGEDMVNQINFTVTSRKPGIFKDKIVEEVMRWDQVVRQHRVSIRVELSRNQFLKPYARDVFQRITDRIAVSNEWSVPIGEDFFSIYVMDMPPHMSGTEVSMPIWLFKGDVYLFDPASDVTSYSFEQMQLMISECYDKERQKWEDLTRKYGADSEPIEDDPPPLPPLPPLPDPIPNHVKLPARQGDARIWKWKSIDEWGKEISQNGIDSAAVSRWYRFQSEIDIFYLEGELVEPRGYYEVKNLLEAEIAQYPQLRALINVKIASLKEAVTNSDKYPIRIPYVWSPSDDDTRSAWFFKKEIYVVEHPSRSRKYTDDQIRQLILEFCGGETSRRERIPEHVRVEVWRRDGGKCVRCGSREKLEYDHIVPVSKGGSNTARNIELLCEKCNREKSNHIQ